MQLSIPPLTEAYSGERKRLVIYSGLLFGVEIAGLQIGHNQSGPFGSFIAFTSADAVPLVLVALIVWSLFRVIVEWFNCDYRRRQTSFARLDVYSGLLLSGLAIAMFAFQRLTAVRLADQMSLVTAGTFVVCFLAANLVGAAFKQVLRYLFLGVCLSGLALIASVLVYVAPISLQALPDNQAHFYAGLAGVFIGVATRTALTSALQTATATSSFWQRLLFLHESISDTDLEKTIQLVSWRLYYCLDDPERSKIMRFMSGGAIVEGANENEAIWRVSKGKLELLDSRGNVFSRFRFQRGSLMLKHTDCKDTVSLPGQYMLIEQG
jgi:hypothetical protein